MKIALITTLIVLGFFTLSQIYMATNQSETQAYSVIRTEKDFEIRFYPSKTMASITSSAKSYKELSSIGFQRLAHYIFGGNEGKQKIAMTSPVYMDINDTASSMSFVMPAQFTIENLPKPNDDRVNLKKIPDQYVAAIRFGGYASDEEILIHRKKLESALNKNAISYYGNFQFLGYNAPYQFWGRRNEIIVQVDGFSK
ncbi:MAG: SOUL family heme-binding protein [Candidatus Kapaibacteriota bacterium]